jgi:hypothetical protein
VRDPRRTARGVVSLGVLLLRAPGRLHAAGVRRALSAGLVVFLAACGGGGGGTSSTFPPDQWTWVDVQGTRCADGTTTGIAVNPAPGASMVLLFLAGGGACWGDGDFACSTGAAEPGPYGEAELRLDEPSLDQSILDRTVDRTPAAGATLVYVPYCTGDVHWGASQEDLAGGGRWGHAGAANLKADIAWLEAHLPAPEKLMVVGSSAGGFGALLAHDLARTAWPQAKGYLVDDSGPPLVGDAVPAELRSAWYASWNLDATLGPLCGVACQDDLSEVVAVLRAKYPDDRLALVSSLRDVAMTSFLGYASAADYQVAVLELVDERYSAPDTHAFLVEGAGHGLLGSPASQEASGTDLASWLRQMVDDEPGWTTLGRPPP